MIPEGMRDVLPPEAAELRAIEHVVLGRFNAYGYGEVRAPALEYPETMERAGVDLLAVGLPPLRRARPRARAAHRPDHGRRPSGGRSSARAPLPLRLAYAGPVYRTEASRSAARGRVRAARRRAARPRAPPPPTPRSSCCSATRSPRPACAATVWRSAAWPSTASWSPPWAWPPTTATTSSTRSPTATTPCSRRSSRGAASTTRAARRCSARSICRPARVLWRPPASWPRARAWRRSSSGSCWCRSSPTTPATASSSASTSVSCPTSTTTPGIVFEAYAPGVDFPVASGGRYDRLLAAFEWPMPAVGFTIDLDRLHQALVDEGAGVAPVFPPPLAFAGGLDDPERVVELRRPAWPSRPCPSDAAAGPAAAARGPRRVRPRDPAPARPAARGATCCAPSGVG